MGLRNGLNFGGLVGQLQPLTDQHINFRVIVDAVFGSEGSSNSTEKSHEHIHVADKRGVLHDSDIIL